MLERTFLHDFGLSGFIHLWGAAGAGKTILASLIAAEASATGHVEWINTDSKKVFIRNLKANVQFVGGKISNINVTIAESHQEAKSVIANLSNIVEEGTNLCVVDPITRTLDLARDDPTLWGQEFVEIILPILASFSRRPGLTIIATSECRQIPNVGTVPLLHRTISKYVDHEVLVRRSQAKSHSGIFLSRYGSTRETLIATMLPRADGSLKLSRTETDMIEAGV